MRMIFTLLALILSTHAHAAGLLGSSGTLSQTAFCRTYICTAPSSATSGGLVRRTYQATKWSIVETRRNGRVVSLRWNTMYQDVFSSPELSVMLGQLTRAATGVALSPQQITGITDLGSESRNIQRSVGSGRLVTLTDMDGEGRQFHFILTSLSTAELAQVDPPRIRMTPTEIAQVTARVRRIGAGFLTFGSGCPGGLRLTGLGPKAPSGGSLQERLYLTVDDVMNRAGFTFQRGFHHQFRATTYEVSELPGGLCLNIQELKF